MERIDILESIGDSFLESYYYSKNYPQLNLEEFRNVSVLVDTSIGKITVIREILYAELILTEYPWCVTEMTEKEYLEKEHRLKCFHFINNYKRMLSIGISKNIISNLREGKGSKILKESLSELQGTAREVIEFAIEVLEKGSINAICSFIVQELGGRATKITLDNLGLAQFEKDIEIPSYRDAELLDTLSKVSLAQLFKWEVINNRINELVLNMLGRIMKRTPFIDTYALMNARIRQPSDIDRIRSMTASVMEGREVDEYALDFNRKDINRCPKCGSELSSIGVCNNEMCDYIVSGEEF